MNSTLILLLYGYVSIYHYYIKNAKSYVHVNAHTVFSIFQELVLIIFTLTLGDPITIGIVPTNNGLHNFSVM